MPQYIYSRLSNGKNAHAVNCPIVKRIPKANRCLLTSREEFIARGFHFCTYCPLSFRNLYRREKEKIDAFVKENRFGFEIRNGIGPKKRAAQRTEIDAELMRDGLDEYYADGME